MADSLTADGRQCRQIWCVYVHTIRQVGAVGMTQRLRKSSATHPESASDMQPPSSTMSCTSLSSLSQQEEAAWSAADPCIGDWCRD